MGRKKRYYFPNVDSSHPTFRVVVTSKSLMERAGEASDIFEKYADKSNQQTPKNILYEMAQKNESLLELSEYASTPEEEGTSPTVNLRPESTSPGKRNPNVPILRRKLSFGNSEKYEFFKPGTSSADQCSIMHVSPPRKNASPLSTGTDLIRSSHIQHLEFNTKPSSPSRVMRNIFVESPSKIQKDVSPKAFGKECASPSDKAKVTKRPDSGSPEEVFKIPKQPDKYGKKASRPAKRSKLCGNLAEISECVSPIKTEEFRIHSDDDKMYISPQRDDKMNESPSKVIDNSPIEIESPLKIETLITSVSIIVDGDIEIEKTSKSKEDPGATGSFSSSEMEHLADDPSRVEWITKAVEDLLRFSDTPKETRADISSSEGQSSSFSPRQSVRTVKKKLSSVLALENKTSFISNPNVMAYLKLKLKSVLSCRNKCLVQIYNFVNVFKKDVNFLSFYLNCILNSMLDIPMEGKHCSKSDLGSLKSTIIKNSTELANDINSILNAVKEDIQFWVQVSHEIRKLNEKYETFLSEESDSQTLEYLEESESNLEIIWERMDRRIFLCDVWIKSLVGISGDFLKLTNNLAKYLVMIDLMKPSSLAMPKEKKLHITWESHTGDVIEN